jgi:hypothetical protein
MDAVTVWRHARAASTAALVLALAGCSASISYREPATPREATTVIRYTGVRRETRRSPDYSSIDRRILTDRSAAP